MRSMLSPLDPGLLVEKFDHDEPLSSLDRDPPGDLSSAVAPNIQPYGFDARPKLMSSPPAARFPSPQSSGSSVWHRSISMGRFRYFADRSFIGKLCCSHQI